MGTQAVISPFDDSFAMDLAFTIDGKQRKVRAFGDGWQTDWVSLSGSGLALKPLVEAATGLTFIDDGSFEVLVQRIHLTNWRTGFNSAGQEYPMKQEETNA